MFASMRAFSINQSIKFNSGLPGCLEERRHTHEKKQNTTLHYTLLLLLYYTTLPVNYNVH